MPSSQEKAGAVIATKISYRQPRTLTPKEKTALSENKFRATKTKSAIPKLYFSVLLLIFTCVGVPEFQNNVYAVSTPVGPCTINSGIDGFPQISLPKLPGTNPRLKCTDKGAEATSTKTLSNRINPECGRCYRSLARYYKDSDDFLFRPLCDPKTGNYLPKQCKDEKHCFCVNVLNGLKLSKEEKPNSQTSCDDGHFDFSIGGGILTKSEKLPSGITIEQRIPIGNPLCKLPKDSGENRCNGKGKGVKWYFDVDTFECLAFNYNGCGGNKNRFDSVTECWDQCKLADMAGCAGMTLPATNSHGHTIVCSSMEAGSAPIQSCPAGYRCTMLAFMGVCCHSATQDLYERNYRPSCVNGKHPLLMEAGGTPANLIGKKCTDNFCPANSSCIEKEIFAHCCPR
uniref:BPTI/Kunitz inhibitor domain-containing protein n=1 Tax=Meloidogyne incognita TaxID=6306 RepID=A0A914KLQ2_MELIC